MASRRSVWLAALLSATTPAAFGQQPVGWCFEGLVPESAATAGVDIGPVAYATDEQTPDANLCGFHDSCAAGLCGDEPCCGDTCNGCCDACSAGEDGCWLPELVLGCFRQTPCGFDDFISPITNPVYFEDPRTLTEMRGIFLQHKVPVAAGGGDIQVYAVQVRAALTDRLSIIATKDGFIESDNPLIDDGWADVSLGLKYNVIRNVYEQRLLSIGTTYELPVGSTRALQGNGDGEFHLFTTGAAKLFENSHWISAFGLRQPTNPNQESQSIYWSNHFDYRLTKKWYALCEFNWFNWTNGGANNALDGVEGGDLFNFGSTGVEGNNLVTGAFGLKYKPKRLTEIGIAWENPLTDRKDVIANRLTVDLILRY